MHSIDTVSIRNYKKFSSLNLRSIEESWIEEYWSMIAVFISLIKYSDQPFIFQSISLHYLIVHEM